MEGLNKAGALRRQNETGGGRPAQRRRKAVHRQRTKEPGDTDEFTGGVNKLREFSSDFSFFLKENSKSYSETREGMIRRKGLRSVVKFQIDVVIYIEKWEDCLAVMSMENINFHEWFELNITTELGFCRESLKERLGVRELKAFKRIYSSAFRR